jgi:hypothetical protein
VAGRDRAARIAALEERSRLSWTLTGGLWGTSSPHMASAQPRWNGRRPGWWRAEPSRSWPRPILYIRRIWTDSNSCRGVPGGCIAGCNTAPGFVTSTVRARIGTAQHGSRADRGRTVDLAAERLWDLQRDFMVLREDLVRSYAMLSALAAPAELQPCQEQPDEDIWGGRT